ncbi:Glycogen debranching enzyme [Halotydeus destructor]|nr:Glycogen debranching enzyme [Halotydeus destructor]
MGSEAVTQVLALQRDQHLESALFHFRPGWSVRFVYGSTLYGEGVTLFINYPKDNKGFVRTHYNELAWKMDENKSKGASGADQTSLAIDVEFKLPGTFHYYFVLDSQPQVNCGSGYFLVEPLLQIGDAIKPLPLDSIQCQTVLTKSLGTFDTWKDVLAVAPKTGYNVIHFTPIQELGASNSVYSLKNHLKLNPSFGSNHGSELTYENIGQFVDYMNKEWSVLSITDVVLNHTANETPWIKEHPECCYNLANSPHLRPAFLLDRLLWHVSLDIISGKWESNGLGAEMNSEYHISKLKEIIHNYYLSEARIHEMFLMDIDQVLKEFAQLLWDYEGAEGKCSEDEVPGNINVVQDAEYRRYKSTIDMRGVFAMFGINGKKPSEGEVGAMCCELRSKLEHANSEITSRVNSHLNAAVENVASAVRYERLQHDGPKIKYVSREHPLVPQYFTFFMEDMELEKEERLIYDSKANVYFMAHNGWVMDYDPLKNFASPDSHVYIRRELIAWSDSVKLRYGETPQDCPFLWEYMRKYVEEVARTFHGIRLDNCHCTPIRAAEYLIDAARAIKPDLYVVAELFTSSEHLDNLFVNRLGINSLIRESMACRDAHELGRCVHRFGGDPVGAFERPTFVPLQKSMAHAIYFDSTHDNECVVVKRSPYDLLATAAVIAMSSCATGSNRGYDELVPHHINIVTEKRKYALWTEDEKLPLDGSLVSSKSGILLAKKAFNDLHLRLGLEGYTQLFVDQVDGNVIAVTRHNPKNLKSVLLVARTSFTKQDANETGFIRNITVSGKINEILFEAKMTGSPDNYSKNGSVINGIQGFCGELKEHLDVSQSEMVTVTSAQGENSIGFKRFTPGSVIAFDVSLEDAHLDAINQLKKISSTAMAAGSELCNMVAKLNLDDLNHVLFRTDQEEKDEHGTGVYEIPNFGRFNYCGLAGLMIHWKDIRTTNDLGHPICGNLRDGNWLPSYLSGRLLWRDSTKPLGNWLLETFDNLSRIPRYLIPRYFDAIIAPLYSMCLTVALENMSSFVANGSQLTQHLAIGSVALVGFNPSAPLPPLAKSLAKQPATRLIDAIEHPVCPTIAAGFPHFASGYMRNWGRDTFIALRGLLLTTHRFSEARNIILGFATTLRHGLIPNLLDRGISSRYNCRDAVWFWLQCIKDYCDMYPNGEGLSLLNDPVQRLYPEDDSEAKVQEQVEQPLHQVMQEALEKHFSGVDFMERNWGKRIDEQMTEPGFNVKAGVNRVTGFVYGGNKHNCGTWMDKMGSSAKAGNKGVPSSPRDGSAVEIVGLSRSVLSWLAKLKQKSLWPYDGVSNASETWSYKDWVEKIDANFEKNFFVELDSKHPLANRREIYKDTFGATEEWQDFQLRSNLVVAMAVAPEMFNKSHAQRTLAICKEVMLGPLGMKTLDPSDWNYLPNYDNSNDSDDKRVAQGFNYHQGPEWLWPMGYYLRAQYIFSDDKAAAVNHINEVLARHYQYIEKDSWLGLPELTNSNGSHCEHSCRTQAWSLATLLDVLYDMEN